MTRIKSNYNLYEANQVLWRAYFFGTRKSQRREFIALRAGGSDIVLLSVSGEVRGAMFDEDRIDLLIADIMDFGRDMDMGGYQWIGQSILDHVLKSFQDAESAFEDD